VNVIHGLNPAKLTQDIEAAIAAGATHLLSFGTAAGLAPSLLPGAIIIAAQVKWQDKSFEADAVWRNELKRALPDAIIADMAAVDAPVTTPAAKASLHVATGAAAADMESQQVARIAAAHRLPFAVLRVVLDTAETALPPAALASTRADGTINYMGLIGSLLKQPQQLPALMRLGRDHAQAVKSLRVCSDSLGSSLFGLMHLGG